MRSTHAAPAPPSPSFAITAVAMLGLAGCSSPGSSAEDDEPHHVGARPRRPRRPWRPIPPPTSSAPAAPPTPRPCPTAPARSSGMSHRPGRRRRIEQPDAHDARRPRSAGQLNPDVNLVDTLNGDEFTVFAPVDEAFAKIDPATIEALKTDTATLTSILTYHVVPGQLAPDDIVGTHTTVQGGDRRGHRHGRRAHGQRRRGHLRRRADRERDRLPHRLGADARDVDDARARDSDRPHRSHGAAVRTRVFSSLEVGCIRLESPGRSNGVAHELEPRARHRARARLHRRPRERLAVGPAAHRRGTARTHRRRHRLVLRDAVGRRARALARMAGTRRARHGARAARPGRLARRESSAAPCAAARMP